MKTYTFLLTSLVFAFSTIQLSAIESKTFYKAPSLSHWALPPAVSLETSDSSSLFRSELIASGSYARSTGKKHFASYLGRKDDVTGEKVGMIGVSASDITLPLFPQDVLHDYENSSDITNATKNPLSEKITIAPWIEQWGFSIATRTYIGSHARVTLSMPLVWKTHHLGMTSTLSTSQKTDDGVAVTLSDYLSGNVTQNVIAATSAESGNMQDALTHAKWKEKQSVSGTQDMTLSLDWTAHTDATTTIDVGGEITLPTTQSSTGQYFFEPLIGTGGHTFIGAQVAVTQTVFTSDIGRMCAHLGIQARAGLTRTHNRTIDYTDPQGNQQFYTRYVLAGKQNARRLFPTPNILTQPVSVTPGSEGKITAGLGFKSSLIDIQANYVFHATGAERVSLTHPWHNATYAPAQFSYDTRGDQTDADLSKHYSAFDVSLHGYGTGLSSGQTTSIDESDLIPASAATSAQQTHTITLALSARPLSALPQSAVHVQGSYSHAASGTLGLRGWECSLSFSHLF